MSLEISDPSLKVVFNWNSSLPAVEEKCLHHLIEQQVRERPDHEAICSATQSFTYQQLDQYASIIAQRLTTLGVLPNTIVALSFEHSIWMPVAMLAVWKTGASCSSVPPSPKHRIQNILDQQGASVILCSATRASTVMHCRRMSMIVDERIISDIENMGWTGDNYESFSTENTSPDYLAYTIFTSGSTGTPKGAQIKHRNFATYVKHWSEAMNIGRESRVYSYSSYMFDVSMSDMITPLCVGATLCIPSDFDRYNNIAGSTRELRVTHAEFVPTLLSTLSPESFDLDTLRSFQVVGEAVPQKLVDTWAKVPQVKLFNAYGPAECCPHSSFRDTTIPGAIAANIGKPMGCSLWIVNPENIEEPLGVGKEGEILIEGPLVGCGYLGEPVKTEAAFPSPPKWLQDFRGIAPTKVYRTGDLGIYREDGSIDYIGRNDLQVKIRGQRMELGEVEYQLQRILPPGTDAVVDVSKPTNGQASLVAFVDLECSQSQSLEDTGITEDEATKGRLLDLVPDLKKRLEDVLPSYMIPSHFVAMDFIPRLASGKVNRKILRATATEMFSGPNLSSRAADTTAWTPMQESIRKVWAKIFEVDSAVLRLEDNFFSLGGDSITAMRIRLEAMKHEISIAMKDVFDHPTIRSLADIAVAGQPLEDELPPFALIPADRHQEARDVAAKLCNINPEEIEDVFPAQMVACYFMLAAASVPGGWVHTNAFKLEPDVDIDRYVECWKAAIQGHVYMRSRIIKTDEAILQVVLKEEHEQIRRADSLDECIKEERSKSMEWGESLSRYCVVDDRSKNERYFVWTAKHAIYDDWSLNLLYQKICRAYATGNLSMKDALKPNAVRKHHLTSDNSSAQNWFRSYFEGAKPTPLFQMPENYKFVDDIQERWTFNLGTPTKSPAFTLSTVIGVSWALALSQRTQTTDFCLGLIRSGRNVSLPGATEFMGPLTGLMPLRVRAKPDAKVYDLLRKYQDDWSESSEHDLYSFIEFIQGDVDPLVKGAVGGATTLNIVHPMESADENLEVEIPVSAPIATNPLDAVQPPATIPAPAMEDLVAAAATEVPVILSTSPSTPSLSSSSSEEDLSTPESSRSSTSTPPPTPYDIAAAGRAPEATKSVPVKDLLHRVREINLGATQKPINLNVYLPKRSEGYSLKVMIRRDTTACTGELTEALAQSFGKIAEQLLHAGPEITVADLTIPDTTGPRASYF